MSHRPVTFSFREDDRNPRHVRISVFIGRNPGARGHSGELVIRTEEWDELRPVWESAPQLLAALSLMSEAAEAQDLLMPLHEQRIVRDALAAAGQVLPAEDQEVSE